MTYFLMQLHFWIYTHPKVMDSYVIPFLIGGLIGLCVVSLI